VRAKELANQAANEVYSPEQRRALAVEVFALRDALVANANTRVLGRYIYGGSADNAEPYTLASPGYTNPATSDPAARRYVFTTALGADNGRVARINDSEVMDVTTGGSFFQGAINALERLGRALEGYRTTPELSTAAPNLGGVAYVFPGEYADQSAAIRDAMNQLDTAMTTFSDERSSLGGRLNRIAQARALNAIIKENVESNRSGIQDADLAETASNLASLQTGYQALLATGAQINRLSLLDFI
jgi:flagellar hook-associated protein 3 FlgL